MFKDIQGFFTDWRNPVEVLILSGMLFVVLSVLRGTRGEGILKGLALLLLLTFAGLALLVDALELRILSALLEALFGASITALVVIFHPELRRGLVEIGKSPFWGEAAGEITFLEELASIVTRLGKKRVGALIAIERQTGLREWIENGTKFDCEVKGDLIDTVFFPGSLLHDGGMIIQNGRIAAAGCQLPLTDQPDLAKSLGLRHRAGIGLSEATDAVAIVVSEETGTVSVAVGGKLVRELDRDSLLSLLRKLCLGSGEAGGAPPASTV